MNVPSTTTHRGRPNNGRLSITCQPSAVESPPYKVGFSRAFRKGQFPAWWDLRLRDRNDLPHSHRLPRLLAGAPGLESCASLDLQVCVEQVTNSASRARSLRAALLLLRAKRFLPRLARF